MDEDELHVEDLDEDQIRHMMMDRQFAATEVSPPKSKKKLGFGRMLKSVKKGLKETVGAKISDSKRRQTIRNGNDPDTSMGLDQSGISGLSRHASMSMVSGMNEGDSINFANGQISASIYNDVNQSSELTNRKAKREWGFSKMIPGKSMMGAFSGDKEKVDNTLMDQIAVKKEDWQHKDYCQICYQKFNQILRQHHCRICGRSCCNDCSEKRQVDWTKIAGGRPEFDDLSQSVNESITRGGSVANIDSMEFQKVQGLKSKSDPVRMCEYCEVKYDNPQIDKFQIQGKQWIKQNNEQNEQELEIYEGINDGLEEHLIAHKSEITKAHTQYNKQKQTLNQKIETVIQDKGNIDNLAKNYQNQATQKQIENQELDEVIDELSSKRAKMMLQLDEALSNVDQMEQKKNDLIRKIQHLEGLEEQRIRKSKKNKFFGNNRNTSQIIRPNIPLSQQYDNPYLKNKKKPNQNVADIEEEQSSSDSSDENNKSQQNKKQNGNRKSGNLNQLNTSDYKHY